MQNQGVQCKLGEPCGEQSRQTYVTMLTFSRFSRSGPRAQKQTSLRKIQGSQFSITSCTNLSTQPAFYGFSADGEGLEGGLAPLVDSELLCRSVVNTASFSLVTP